jgi:hypothetical protein
VAQAASLSLSKFTAAVQTAVQAAVQKHPKFKIDPPAQVALSYLIRGIPVPEEIVANATLGETRAFAADIAAQLGSSLPEGVLHAAGKRPEVAIYSQGSHVTIGIPAIADLLIEK